MANALRFTRHHWPSLFLVLFVLGVSFFGFAKVPPDAKPKPSASWVLTPEAGQIFALVIDANTVWAGGKDGVFRIDRKTGRLLEHLKLGTDVAMVRSLAVCPDGTLWIGHTNGLTWYSKGRTTTFSERDGLPGLRVNALFSGNNTLWIGTSNGLASIVDGKPQLSPLTAKLSSPVVNALFEDASGDLWVGSSSRPTGA